jgi:RHH-type transcriptional regulator, proline utilization regulon repressor / proline dehydrogenase / delta 1-pyrroline-5-carboxylate dehydrogenase
MAGSSITPATAWRVEEAIELAARLQRRATSLQTPAERRQQAELDRMLQHPGDKKTIVQLTDEAFRSRSVTRVAEHLTHILDVQGVPRFFSPLERTMLGGFRTFGGWLPSVAVPLVKEQMRHETANVVLPAEPEHLVPHLRARGADGVRMNLNFLGEALLGEQEAERRLAKYLAALQLPEVEVLSVKISTLTSQLAPHAREATLALLCDRLEPLYREAARLRFRRPDGTEVPKFVYLDMEEYRDLELTAQVFMRTLDRPGLEHFSAGIALQAYLPDSAPMQKRIVDWARQRVAKGGAPVTIRLVKGANMEAERVEAALRGWPQAPYKSKADTDANFKRMLNRAFDPESLAAVSLGIASHNLFDVAYGVVRWRDLLLVRPELSGRIQFEMLEGMANHQRRALREEVTNLLLYAPACPRDEFLNAIGYLLRRLDENTGPENFLRHAFRLVPDSDDWKRLERGFRDAFRRTPQETPRRTQNRLVEMSAPIAQLVRPERPWTEFANEPDTDFALDANVQWIEQVVGTAPQRTEPRVIPLVIGDVWRGRTAEQKPPIRATRPCVDPSQTPSPAGQWHYTEGTPQDADDALACAADDPDGWRAQSLDQRNTILGQVAAELRRARGLLMHVALAEGGKTVTESDPEVSEAIDFVEFYRANARWWYDHPELAAQPRGVVVVVSPWNFPIAIPCGGIAAALAAGNTVILKPASHTVRVAYELCECFWRGGVPKSALQFVPCPGGTAGARLVADPRVSAVILTGGTGTAARMLSATPNLPLFAETGGKNATIVTALSDRELAIKHVVQSAFGHGGQKCSATSLLLLQDEVYDDPLFRQTLCDAAASWSVGSAWKLDTRLGPLIRPPSGELDEALKTLEPGEEWALRPHPVAGNPALWSPGIKYGVTPGSVTHTTEFFGPVLGVMRFEKLDEAIDLVNATGYGLTSGLFSLDEREHEVWKERIRAGNLYINRGTTGAIVLRQPFGGHGLSGFGPGMKAGGPNYIPQFLSFESRPDSSVPTTRPTHTDLARLHDALLDASITQNLDPTELTRIRRALLSLDQAWRDEFSREHDHFRLLGQDNLRRYQPFQEIRVRIDPRDSAFDLFIRTAAARVTGARVIVSGPLEFDSPPLVALDRATEAWGAGVEFLEEQDEELATWLATLPPHSPARLRLANRDRATPALRTAANQAFQYLADEPVSDCGRLELLWYLREQSVCADYHRYGNLGVRSDEERTRVE